MSNEKRPTSSDVAQRVQTIVNESLALKQRFFSESVEMIVRIANEVVRALKSGNKVLLFGNGGSAADAQHIAAEFVNRFLHDRPGLPAIALTTDTSALTSIGNDLGFEYVFSRQIEALGKKSDVAIGISTSGNSPNVLHGIRRAKEMGLVTVGFTGRDGGKLGPLVDYHVHVPHPATARVQEIHIMVGHIVCQLVDEELLKI